MDAVEQHEAVNVAGRDALVTEDERVLPTRNSLNSCHVSRAPFPLRARPRARPRRPLHVGGARIRPAETGRRIPLWYYEAVFHIDHPTMSDSMKDRLIRK